MIELKDGKECKDCKIFTDNVEGEALETVKALCDQPEFKGSKIRCMPDIHQGKGIVIGFTAPAGDYVNPDHIGCDIGCTVSAMFFITRLDPSMYREFERRVSKAVPQGIRIHETSQVDLKDLLAHLRTALEKAYQTSGGLTRIIPMNSREDLEEWTRSVGMDLGMFLKSLGTLGGGNHYMEYDIGAFVQCFSVHTGSRNLGLKVWKKWSDRASGRKIDKDVKRKITEEVKAKNTDRTKLKDEIWQAIEDYKKTQHPGYLSGEDLSSYLTDMVIAQAYAKYNHHVILKKVEKIHQDLTGDRGPAVQVIQTTHNYLDFDSSPMMIRKGAVSAREGEQFILPFNMRDGIAWCEGLGNPDWNYSAPHGAGRIMSREKAKETLNMTDFLSDMKDVCTYSVVPATIDESPRAYKSREEIIKLIEPTCKVLFLLKPVINIKAAEEVQDAWRKKKKRD